MVTLGNLVMSDKDPIVEHQITVKWDPHDAGWRYYLERREDHGNGMKTEWECVAYGNKEWASRNARYYRIEIPEVKK